MLPLPNWHLFLDASCVCVAAALWSLRYRKIAEMQEVTTMEGTSGIVGMLIVMGGLLFFIVHGPRPIVRRFMRGCMVFVIQYCIALLFKPWIRNPNNRRFHLPTEATHVLGIVVGIGWFLSVYEKDDDQRFEQSVQYFDQGVVLILGRWTCVFACVCVGVGWGA